MSFPKLTGRFPRGLAGLLAAAFSATGAAAPSPEAVRPPSATPVAARPSAAPAPGALFAALKPGQRVEIKLDMDKLFALKRHDAVKLPLGALGELPVVFDHATKVLNNVAYWEAHLDGDLAQRVSLRLENKQLTGVFYLRDRRLNIETVNGRSFLVSSGTHEQAQQLANAPRPLARVPAVAAEPIGYPDEAAPRASWPVAVHAEQLKQVPLNTEVVFDLPDGRSVNVVHDKAELGVNGTHTFIGYVREHGTDHRVVISTGPDGAAYGVLNLREGEVRLESRMGKQWMVDVKKSGLSYAPMSEPLIPPGPAEMPAVQAFQAAKPGAAPQAAATTASTAPAGAAAPVPQAASDITDVALMVVYGHGLVNRLGSTSAALTRIDNMVAITNQAMLDSDVRIRMRLVYTTVTDQDDNISQATSLNNMYSGQGAFGFLAGARSKYAADLVMFVHKPTVGVGSCGLAYLSVTKGTQGPLGNAAAGLSVVDESCPNWVTAHELGHNFGNNHDHAQGGSEPVYPYSWGYLIPGTSNGDIMSYAANYYYKYSNPRLNGCFGQVCGQVNYADAAQSMNKVREIVAAYRVGTSTSVGSPSNSTCFYADINYQGEVRCVVDGASNLPASWDNRISSVKVFPGKSVTLYKDPSLGGGSLILATDNPNLTGRGFNDVVSSYVSRDNLNGRFLMQAAHSGKCVDLYGGNTYDGAPLVQWSCGSGANQWFDMNYAGTDAGGAYYRITIARTGKVVSVAGASIANGAKIQQWTSNGSNAQQFYLRRVNSVDFAVINRHSGKALDVPGQSLADAVQLQQWGFVGNANQRFRLAAP